MDAGLMTWYAKNWKNVPAMSTCESAMNDPKKTIGSNSNEFFTIDLIECGNNIDTKRQLSYTEQVQVFVTLSTTKRGENEIYLYSPSNTKTQILPVRINES
jgi:subtilisin-like proprotein convertase family protein